MGTGDFYLNVKLKNESTDFIHEIIKSNRVYKDFIGYYIDLESKELSLQAARISFFPICEIIYGLLKKVNKENPIESITSRKISNPFNFNNSLEFFCWMYNTWKEPLTQFNRDCGVFLISTADYYNRFNVRLRKKHYIKISLDE